MSILWQSSLYAFGFYVALNALVILVLGILVTRARIVTKTDIGDAGSALAWIDDMRVRDFTVKANGERRTGVIAQEMLKTHPELVRMGRDGYYAVEEPNPWKLVKALQELKAANDNQASEIKVLRARLDTLEAARR